MFQRLLVPLDGSIRAEQAIPTAGRLARAVGGKIVLVRVVSTSTEYWPYMATEPESMVQTVIDADLDEAKQYLNRMARHPDLAEIETEAVAIIGPVASTILTLARSYATELIVLCSHGYTGMKRWLMGSIAEKVALHATIPVLILNEGGPLTHSHTDPARSFRALLPLDGSARARSALEPALQLVAGLSQQTTGEVHLLRVVKPPIVEHEDEETHQPIELAQRIQRAEQYLHMVIDQTQTKLPSTGIPHLTSSVVVSHDVAETILTIAEHGDGTLPRECSDLLVLTTHGHGGLLRWAVGSITERVLRASRLPILVIRPADMVNHVPAIPEGAQVSTTYR
ncbi:MAG TPA: universal stress protein [Ktedonobacteraceae bacterium]|jgi:nucleotide-binding universal stress UspA family protein|nr:universal stress protein [Ktedonobacteraceae bacterium]